MADGSVLMLGQIQLPSCVLLLVLLAAVCLFYMRTTAPGKERKAETLKASAQIPALDEEACAVLLAAVAEETALAGEELRVKSVRMLQPA